MRLSLVTRLNSDYSRNLAKVAVASSATLVFVALSSRALLSWRGTDFPAFYPAAVALLQRHDPYAATPYFLAPAPEALLYAPVAWLPFEAARMVWAIIMLLLIPVLVWAACRAVQIRLAWWQWPPALVSGLILCSNGWITCQPTLLIAVVLALTLALPTPKIGLLWWLLLVKPQITLPVAFILFVTHGKAYRRYAVIGGVGAFGLTLLLYPMWPIVYVNEWNRIQTFGAYWWTTTFHDYVWYIFPDFRSIITPMYAVLCICSTIIWLRLVRAWRQARIDRTILIINTLALTLALTPYARDYDFPLLMLPYMLLWRYAGGLALLGRYLLYGALGVFPIPYLLGGDMPYFWLYPAVLAGACVTMSLRLSPLPEKAATS